MSNKIDAYTTALAAVRNATRSASAEASSPTTAASAKVAPAPIADSVKLTGEGRYLHQLNAVIKALPTASEARVQRIQAALRDGSYQIDPQAIASKLARTEWELGYK